MACDCGIERGFADFDPRRRLANREALGEKRLGAPELFVGHDRFASALASAHRRSVETCAGAFADEVTLELP